jgi:hypothetical protein
MALPTAFLKHGTFIYVAAETMERYKALGADGVGVAKAMNQLGMSHAWVRLFGSGVVEPRTPTEKLVTALRSANINVAGWGYCKGDNWELDCNQASDLSDHYHLTSFVADIEPGNNPDMASPKQWNVDKLEKLLAALQKKFGKDNLAISTWPFPDIHQSDFHATTLMKAAADYVGAFAPQAYWFDYPTDIHYETLGVNDQHYRRDNPVAFANLVIDDWARRHPGKPIIVTGQAFWEERENRPFMTPGDLERKLEVMWPTQAGSPGFDRWSDIVGLNWWHFGKPIRPGTIDWDKKGAMSEPMFAKLRHAGLGSKPYQPAA